METFRGQFYTFSEFGSVQSLSHVTPWTAARQASLSITNSWSLLKLTPIKSVMPSSHLILCHPLRLLPPNPSQNQGLFHESTLRMRWPKYWSFSFSIRPSNEHPRLISFRMDWLDLPAVQGTLKSLLQHHSSKASILQRSAFSHYCKTLLLFLSVLYLIFLTSFCVKVIIIKDLLFSFLLNFTMYTYLDGFLKNYR